MCVDAYKETPKVTPLSWKRFWLGWPGEWNTLWSTNSIVEGDKVEICSRQAYQVWAVRPFLWKVPL